MRDTMGLLLLSNGKDPANFTAADYDAALDKLKKAVSSGQIREFEGPDGLVTALSGGRSPDPDPGPGGPLDDGLGRQDALWVDQARRQERAITPAQLRITYLSADHVA